MQGLRLRRGGPGKARSAEQPKQGGAALSCATLPMLSEVLLMLPAEDIARQMMVDRAGLLTAQALRGRVLERRHAAAAAGWSWRKAHAVESADFRDLPCSDGAAWTPGPNDRYESNVIERSGDDDEWIWLSRGTDWQSFQGGLRVVSESGIRPAWVTFQVRVATPEVSGANLALASRESGWALQRPSLLFSYRGDDCSPRRCFMLETCAAASGRFERHPCRPADEVVPGEVYKVAIHFDWSRGSLQMFINGKTHVQAAPFDTAEPICLAAIYNWRSNAVTGFSELMLGSTCPYELEDPIEVRGSRRQWSCPGRQSPTPHPSTALVARTLLSAVAALALTGFAAMMAAEHWLG